MSISTNTNSWHTLFRGVFTIGICFCVFSSWSQTDSTTFKAPEIIHISSSAPVANGSFLTYDTLSVNSEFTVLSLVSKELFDNWNAAELKNKYGRKACLLVIAREGSRQKTEFVLSFYRNWNTTNSIQKAYELTIKEAGVTHEIKHFLIINKE